MSYIIGLATIVVFLIQCEAAEDRPTVATTTPPAPIAEEFCAVSLNVTRATVGFFEDPSDCTAYFQCFQQGHKVRGWHQYCPQGSYWHQGVMTCVKGNLHCIQDPCENDVISYIGFYSGSNCAEFLKCDNGRSVPQCCPDGMRWSNVSLWCELDDLCFDSCFVDNRGGQQEEVTTPASLVGECFVAGYFYAAVDGDEQMYRQTSADRNTTYVMRCPVTVPKFSVLACGCVVSARNPGPDPCVTFDFEQSFSPRHVWVGATNARLEDGNVCFDGNGKLEVPYYDNQDLNHELALFMNFSPAANSGSNSSSLITNGNSVLEPSVAIAYENGVVFVTIQVERRLEGSCTLKHTLSTDLDNHNLDLTFDGKTMTLNVDRVTQTMNCEGDIKLNAAPVVIGQNYRGCIGMIKVCKQLPPLMPAN